MNIPDLNEHGNVAFVTTSTIAGAISRFYEHFAPWLLLGLVLVLVDLRFGMAAARVNIRCTHMEWLEQRAGRDAIVRIHVEGIKGYVKRYQE